ncbi:uncharacterized protein AtWU_01369 [Aspergillus tubingensis]|uniref:uncharacterized protein n=1 Tax=Aspergillus tubingensis TaxID=5068 RepID=UPI0015792765|nr:uncharacterized protein AtWU_01369 [Aspergillus tubingensis]GFN11572.1 hypothetical protein AtWU_01369 [Aspergillus tubingensis]
MSQYDLDETISGPKGKGGFRSTVDGFFVFLVPRIRRPSTALAWALLFSHGHLRPGPHPNALAQKNPFSVKGKRSLVRFFHSTAKVTCSFSWDPGSDGGAAPPIV